MTNASVEEIEIAEGQTNTPKVEVYLHTMLSRAQNTKDALETGNRERYSIHQVGYECLLGTRTGR